MLKAFCDICKEETKCKSNIICCLTEENNIYSDNVTGVVVHKVRHVCPTCGNKILALFGVLGDIGFTAEGKVKKELV